MSYACRNDGVRAMAIVIPTASHHSDGHRLDVSTIELGAGVFAPTYTDILLDWRCPHGQAALAHVQREAWAQAEARAPALAALWHALQEVCDRCAAARLPALGDVLSREGAV